MCQALEVSRSGYYCHRQHRPAPPSSPMRTHMEVAGFREVGISATAWPGRCDDVRRLWDVWGETVVSAVSGGRQEARGMGRRLRFLLCDCVPRIYLA